MHACRRAHRTGTVSVVLKMTCLPGLIVVFLFCFFFPARAHSAEYLTASGCSVSNTGYLTELAKEYERRTGVKVFVRGGGSVVGIEDLRSGKVDFAAACRSRAADDPTDIEFVQVAWDALVFIAHRSNPVGNVSLAAVRSIYSGAISDWEQLGGAHAPIKVFISRTRQGLSGVEASTRALVLNGAEPIESPNTLFVASSGIVEQMVEETPGGFATTGFTSARKRNVKMLKVNGIAPTNKAIIQNRYPLKRPLYLLVPKAAKPEVKRFVDFTLSREGQHYLRSLNVISLLDIK
jgi:phosphate transport system substrate-binding protein